jgi:hypothetical protein
MLGRRAARETAPGETESSVFRRVRELKSPGIPHFRLKKRNPRRCA